MERKCENEDKERLGMSIESAKGRREWRGFKCVTS